jgi:hypothetical protein
MSIKPYNSTEIPEETPRTAKAAFPRGNVYLWMRDELGEMYKDSVFADLQQYWIKYLDDHDDHFDVHLRADDNQPSGEKRIHSPYDVEARFSAKRSTDWIGYKVILTETCDDDLPHIITNVETTSAVEQDVSLTDRIHRSLENKGLLPSDHLLDAGFIDAELLVQAQDDFVLSDFQINWGERTAVCPQSKISKAWSEQSTAYYFLVNQIKFRPSDCNPCPVRNRCTRSKRGPRYLMVLPRRHHEALQPARKEQKKPSSGKSTQNDQVLKEPSLKEYELLTFAAPDTSAWPRPTSRWW